jgi:hypothetical protein
MDWKQKFTALDALAPASLKLDVNKNWFVSHTGVERKEGGCLATGGGGHADTVDKAVENYWNWLVCESYYVVVNAYGQRRAVRWNGFMWEDVYEGDK